MIRKIDRCGRFTIPTHLRKKINLEADDWLEICRDGDTIMLRKISPSCVICGESKDLKEYRGKHICRECIMNGSDYI